MDRSLAGYLGDGPADSSILPIFRRTLEALHSIHGAGGSHLPLSPATIRFDDAGEPQIRSSPRLHESADTVAFGSAKYSAPDAFTRTESTSCESADCYVLGFIFYEILVGKRWFEAQFGSLENGPSALWLKWHADRTANARPVIELRPNLGDFARLIDGMMEKDPRKRINSISQVLAGFANFEAQTTYKTDPGSRAATPSKSRELYELVRSKATLTGAWLAKRVSAIRKLRLSAVKIVLSAAAIGVTAMLFYREIPLHHVPHPAPAATAPALPRIPLPTERAKPVLQIPPLPDRGTIPPAPAPAPDTATLPSPPAPEPESELQIESRLNSRTLLLLDDLRPVTVSPGSMFSEKIKPGTHKLKLLTRSNSFVQLPLDVNDEGILVLKRPTARSLRYVMVASSGKSAKLYASPEARVGLRGEVYEPIPAEGMSIANDSAVTVLLNEDSKSQVRLNPLPARSIRIVLEPNAWRSLTTVEINANVPDAGVVINGEKLARSLENGVTLLHLRPGEYHVKLVHPEYQDSAEQDLVISGNEPRQRMEFSLSPVVRQSTARDLPAEETVHASGESAKSLAKIVFHVLPANAQITYRRDGDSESQTCPNSHPCLLRPGTYEVTAIAEGFKTAMNHVFVGEGEEKPYEWKLDAIPSTLKPADLFENAQTWTVDANGWWSHKQPGYSFLRAKEGTFVFEILKSSGLFASNKISLVVNYQGDDNRVLYTIDKHTLHRNERAPGVQVPDYSVPHEIPAGSEYRLALELLPDRVIVRNGAGKVLDNLALTKPGNGKVGFSGKVKVRIVQAGSTH